METDFIEDIYTKVDTEFAPIYANILKLEGDGELSPAQVAHLIRFITVSYYRVPATDDLIKQLVLNTSPKKLGFKITDKQSQSDATPEIYKKIISEPAFIESYRISKALLEMAAHSKFIKFNDWAVVGCEETERGGLIGDNPVILREDFLGYLIVHQLIMPFSKCHIAYHFQQGKPVLISREHRHLIDMLQYIQAEQFVCGSNKEHMENIIADVDKFNTPNGKHRPKVNCLRADEIEDSHRQSNFAGDIFNEILIPAVFINI